MSNEPNKPIAAQELTEKELEGVVGGKVKVAVLSEAQELTFHCTAFEQ